MDQTKGSSTLRSPTKSIKEFVINTPTFGDLDSSDKKKKRRGRPPKNENKDAFQPKSHHAKKKIEHNSDVPNSEVDHTKLEVIKRATTLSEGDENLEILGARKLEGKINFAVRNIKEEKVYWYTHEKMKLEHLALLLNFYEKSMSFEEIVTERK